MPRAPSLTRMATCLLVFTLALAVPWRAWPDGPLEQFAVNGVRLGMNPEEVAAATGVQAQPLTSPDGRVLSWLARTKKGHAGGGFFQVAFAGEDLGRRAYTVTLNNRTKTPGQDLDPLLDVFVGRYGPPLRLCVNRFPKYVEYVAWWGAAPPGCEGVTGTGPAPDAPHMCLNLISGTWTEVFLTLRDPALFAKNVELARQGRKDGPKTLTPPDTPAPGGDPAARGASAPQ